MFTTFLAFLLILCGFASVAAGGWGAWTFLQQEERRIPVRYYGITIGLIAGGVGLIGLGQVLRLLLDLNAKL